MALLPLLSFSSGELDPILTDNVTLEKFKKGLSTARNVMVGKTGALLTRFSRRIVFNAKLANKKIKIYQPPNTEYVLEWGVGYLRVHYGIGLNSTFGSSFVELATDLTEDQTQILHFTTSRDTVYAFVAGHKMFKLNLSLGTSNFASDAAMFYINPAPNAPSITPVGTPAGYAVDYMATLVINGEESLASQTSGAGYPKPIASGQSNKVTVGWTTASINNAEVTEVRVYSRPNAGGAFGLLGTTNVITTASGNSSAVYTDIGNLPDYTKGNQDLITKYGLGSVGLINLNPTTGTVYQQRLILTSSIDKEALIASRPGQKGNFFRDFPLNAESALLFKAGTSGKANVLRIIENEGLVVFTSNGVYTNGGLLGPTNTVLERRGAWIIDVNIPPLVVPGGLFFVDTSNCIRQMIFSQEILAYQSIEQSIFSNHLFKTRKIKSWCYQTGTTPVIIVTFSDGTFATFTYNFEHEMRAWTRHDSAYPVEQVEGSLEYDKTYFVTNKNGQRQVEVTIPRYVAVEDLVNDSETDIKLSCMFADGIREWNNTVGLSFLASLTLVPVVAGNWSGQLKVTYTDQELPGGHGPWYGQPFVRWFDPVNKNAIDLTIVSSEGTQTIFQPSETFPSKYAVGPRLYTVAQGMGSLQHLEGEKVAVIVDGGVVASPNNDQDVYPVITVVGGSITLPDGMYGALIEVGRPIVADIKTLNISTLEQSPTLIESLTVNKMYIRFNESRGVYVSNDFPEEKLLLKDGHSVDGMEAMDEVTEDADLLGNRYFKPHSRRYERTLPGSWQSQGQISMRQVDPYHFEILSIIPDVEILRRSDR